MSALTPSIGIGAVLGYYAIASTPSLRAQTASRNFHPTNFAGWDQLDAAVREALATMPADTRLVAGNFKIGAELGFVRDDADIAVLAHPLAYKLTRSKLRALIAQWRDCGGDAVEVALPGLTATDMEMVAQLTREAGLRASAGSDFHAEGGWNTPARIPPLPACVEPVKPMSPAR